MRMIKIVLIEDLPMIKEGLNLLLNRIDDFTVVAEYSNGKEFIDDIDAIEADIILTDINMPIMDGIEATKIALSLNPNLNIIALSMYSDRKYYYEMVTAGAKGFVLKQASSSELETAIRDVKNGGNYFSPDLLRTVIIEMQGIEAEIIKDRNDFLKLTERETKVIALLCQGLTNKEIAEKLFVSLRTIEVSKSKLMQKTKTRNNASLIIWSIKNNLVTI